MKGLLDIAFDYAQQTASDPSYTHPLHPFPAKFPPQLPRSILSKFADRGSLILDPFCGSGTTLVEARLMGMNSVGVDINGLACLISQVKATPLSSKQLDVARRAIDAIADKALRWRLGRRKKVTVPNIDGIEHWFQANVADELAVILDAIRRITDEKAANFLKVAFSSIIVRVSNQDSDTRFAAIDKEIPDGFTLDLFVSKGRESLSQMKEFSEKADRKATVRTYNADSRKLSFLRDETFDLVVTSPPYANTYDYYLYHKFRKRWLGIDVRFAQYNEIGSRREYSSLKERPEKWMQDLRACFDEMLRVLRKGGTMAIVGLS